MSDDELERRIEELEQDVGALKEALQSVLEWKARPSAVRVGAYNDLHIRFEGQENLDRIP